MASSPAAQHGSVAARGLTLATLLCAGLAGVVTAQPAGSSPQSAGVNQGGSEYIHAPAGLNPGVRQNAGDSAAAKVDQMRQAERRRRVALDATRLQTLSTELKAELDRTPADQLSADSLKKAAEIEKVAHDLRQWMTSY